MPNDNAINRLLYAILSQKSLKDIDWNKVAHDPILSQEITNGHAARMRYSRFKKQMDGTASVRRPRNPNSPRKNKVEKNKSPKKVKSRKASDDDNIKLEAGEEEAGSSQNTTEGTPEVGMDGVRLGLSQGAGITGTASPIVKTEPGVSSSGSSPSTPLREHSQSQSQTPGEEYEAAGAMSDMDEMMASFGMPGHAMAGEHAMYQPMMGEAVMAQQGYGMGMHMGMGDPFEGLWGGHGSQQSQASADGGVLVKMEERWDDAYRHV